MCLHVERDDRGGWLRALEANNGEAIGIGARDRFAVELIGGVWRNMAKDGPALGRLSGAHGRGDRNRRRLRRGDGLEPRRRFGDNWRGSDRRFGKGNGLDCGSRASGETQADGDEREDYSRPVSCFHLFNAVSASKYAS